MQLRTVLRAKPLWIGVEWPERTAVLLLPFTPRTETTTEGRMAERRGGGAHAVAAACCEPAALTEAEVLTVTALTKGEVWRRSHCKSRQIATGGRWRWNYHKCYYDCISLSPICPFC
ncbi:hypothetical protein OROMI_019623 [Orobanche minor]